MSDKNNPKISIIDYGVGNLYSIRKACLEFTDNVIITESPTVIESADAVILPGVGAFKFGMEGLEKRGLLGVVKKFASREKPVLGICLGAQLLLEKGYEFGEFEGLGLIPGKVVIFPEFKNVKIPQIGWNKINFLKTGKGLFGSLEPDPYVYFVHSYILKPKDSNHILSKSTYGGYTFCSTVKKGNIYGTQFHPEKSGEVGLKIIENFIKLTKKVNI